MKLEVFEQRDSMEQILHQYGYVVKEFKHDKNKEDVCFTVYSEELQESKDYVFPEARFTTLIWADFYRMTSSKQYVVSQEMMTNLMKSLLANNFSFNGIFKRTDRIYHVFKYNDLKSTYIYINVDYTDIYAPIDIYIETKAECVDTEVFSDSFNIAFNKNMTVEDIIKNILSKIKQFYLTDGVIERLESQLSTDDIKLHVVSSHVAIVAILDQKGNMVQDFKLISHLHNQEFIFHHHNKEASYKKSYLANNLSFAEFIAIMVNKVKENKRIISSLNELTEQLSL